MKKIGVKNEDNGKLTQMESQLELINDVIKRSKLHYLAIFGDALFDVIPDVKVNLSEFDVIILLRDWVCINLTEFNDFELSIQTICQLRGIKVNFKYKTA